MSFQRPFISFIFMARLLKGLTQNELAEKSGISLRTIQRIERFEVNGSIFSLNAIGQILDLTFPPEINEQEDIGFNSKIKMNNLSVLFSNFTSFWKYNWPVIYFSTIIFFIILLWSVKVYSPLPLKDSSSFSINTIYCGTSQECDIEIIKKNQSGKTLWRKVIGRSSYDKAGGFLKTETGEFMW